MEKEARPVLAQLVTLSLLLVVATAIVYWPALDAEFILPWDDEKYVVKNLAVSNGLTGDGLAWAFTAVHASNWHPLTWLSHMLDVELFGLDPRGHHAVNMLLHAVNAVLLLLVLVRMTRAVGRSAVVAFLFALHPLHVESVAWVSERKDLLSGFFMMLVLLLYARYAERPGAARYVALTAAFAFGLLAKPMLVTLPFVLVLLDYWPLGRVRLSDAASRRRLLLEKVPLLILSLASASVTVLAQKSGGAVSGLDQVSMGARLANAVVAYGAYLRKTFWPFDLAAFYPYPDQGVPAWQVVLSGAVLVAVTLIAVRLARRAPYFIVGWLTYLGMLVPVIGIVQVGRQAMADRYTYLPLIGIFVIVSWGAFDLAGRAKVPAPLLGSTACLAMIALVPVTRAQVRTWHDGVSLFGRAVEMSSNYWSHFNLAASLVESGDLAGAEREFRRAVELRPDDAEVRYYLGRTLMMQRRPDEALREYETTLGLDPEQVGSLMDMGMLLAGARNMVGALDAFTRVLAIDPAEPQARFNRATILRQTGRLDEAIADYRELVRVDPQMGRAHEGLAMALYLAGDLDGAWQSVQTARALGFEPNPDFVHDLSLRLSSPGR